MVMSGISPELGKSTIAQRSLASYQLIISNNVYVHRVAHGTERRTYLRRSDFNAI